MEDKRLSICLLGGRFCVLKITKAEQADLAVPFTFLSVTDEEISLVCPESAAPASALAREDGWRCFRIEGTLDFSLIGIIAQISKCLAEECVSVFVVSTYNTDYFMVREEWLDITRAALLRAGYTLSKR